MSISMKKIQNYSKRLHSFLDRFVYIRIYEECKNYVLRFSFLLLKGKNNLRKNEGRIVTMRAGIKGRRAEGKRRMNEGGKTVMKVTAFDARSG